MGTNGHPKAAAIDLKKTRFSSFDFQSDNFGWNEKLDNENRCSDQFSIDIDMPGQEQIDTVLHLFDSIFYLSPSDSIFYSQFEIDSSFSQNNQRLSGTNITLDLNFINTNFDGLDHLLDDSEIGVLEDDELSIHMGGGIEAYYENFYWGLGIGGANIDVENDSLKLSAASHHLRFDFGYSILNQGVQITPYAGVFSLRSKIHVGSRDNIYLVDHLRRNEIDLRFIRYYGKFGTHFNFRIPNTGQGFAGPTYLRIKVDYLVPLHKNTIIKTRKSRLNSQSVFKLNRWVIGLSVAFWLVQ